MQLQPSASCESHTVYASQSALNDRQLLSLSLTGRKTFFEGQLWLIQLRVQPTKQSTTAASTSASMQRRILLVVSALCDTHSGTAFSSWLQLRREAFSSCFSRAAFPLHKAVPELSQRLLLIHRLCHCHYGCLGRIIYLWRSNVSSHGVKSEAAQHGQRCHRVDSSLPAGMAHARNLTTRCKYIKPYTEVPFVAAAVSANGSGLHL